MSGRNGTHSRQPGDVDAGEESRDAGRGLVCLTEPFETRVWDGDAGFFGVDGGIRKIGCLAEVCRGLSTKSLDRLGSAYRSRTMR